MSHYADEQYSVYHEVRVIARKEHECCSVLCSEPIRKGDEYWRIFTAFEGVGRTYKRCVRCQALHEHLREKCGEARDNMWPDERLACGLDYEEEWGEMPEYIEALAFWKPGDPLPEELLPPKPKEGVT